MTLSYGRGLPPEQVSYSLTDRHGRERTYRAIETGSGQNWDVVDPSGRLIKNGIVHSNRWQASAQLTSWAMQDHDASRQAAPSPRQDRVVKVDEMGGDLESPIYGRVRTLR